MAESPAHIGSLIDSLATRYRWQKRFTRSQLWEKWPEIAGDAISKHSWPLKFRERDVLVIAVSDSVWMQQLSLQKLVILDAINRGLPPEAMIRDLHFTLGNIEEAKRAFMPATHASKKPESLETNNISLEMRRRIEQEAKAVTEPVRDEELRQALQQMYRKSRLRLISEAGQS